MQHLIEYRFSGGNHGAKPLLAQVRPRIRHKLHSRACSAFGTELRSSSAPIIGSGIFLVPGPIAQKLPTLALVLLVWIAGGILSLFGSLSIGELACNYPGAGGLYISCGASMGGRSRSSMDGPLLSLIQSGSIATLASGFALYTSKILTLTPLNSRHCTMAILWFSHRQSCASAWRERTEHWRHQQTDRGSLSSSPSLSARGHTVFSTSQSPPHTFVSLLVDFGVALIAVLWAYGRLALVSFTAGEFKSPARRSAAQSLVGTLMVTAIYLLANIAYYAVLTPLK